MSFGNQRLATGARRLASRLVRIHELGELPDDLGILGYHLENHLLAAPRTGQPPDHLPDEVVRQCRGAGVSSSVGNPHLSFGDQGALQGHGQSSRGFLPLPLGGPRAT